MTPLATKHSIIKIRPDTRRKIERIAQVRGWKLVEAAARAVDALFEREGFQAVSTASASPMAESLAGNGLHDGRDGNDSAITKIGQENKSTVVDATVA